MTQLGDGYLAGLNIQRKFTPTSSSSDGGGGSDGLSSAQRTGIIVGCVVGGVALLAAVGALVAVRVVARRTHRRWGLFGEAVPPGVGPGTTLLVTDIENSTLLW